MATSPDSTATIAAERAKKIRDDATKLRQANTQAMLNKQDKVIGNIVKNPIIKKLGGTSSPNHSVARVVNNYNDIPKGETSIGKSTMAKHQVQTLKKVDLKRNVKQLKNK